ncbi:MAG: hypothetical protein U9R58_01475 [Chloroflexota bacterium]|nr:hypothetical protein [Chloroflexota bacterium]
MEHKGLNQLLCAALVDKRFCADLVQNPAEAMEKGYRNHSFDLSRPEYEMLQQISADNIEDFAFQVHGWISTDVVQEQNRRDNLHVRPVHFDPSHTLALPAFSSAS